MKIIPREARRITYSTKIRALKKLNLSALQKSVLIGSALGDGNLELNWSKTNYRLRIGGSEKQKDYIFWKYNILKNIVLTEPKYSLPTKSFHFSTISHPEISELGKIFYCGKKKVLPDKISELIKNRTAIAVWFMDDGNVIRRNGKIYGYHFNTQSFSKEENAMLVKMLENIYGIESMIENNHDYYRIRIMRKHSREILKQIIGNIIIPSMQYKIS
ncbi:MAG: hypothetical protein Q7K11_00705 [Candidatus Berkelbacteria bacterium]|nr:hypothetical protein [Candidatus Berkelbacteria bacterium]